MFACVCLPYESGLIFVFLCWVPSHLPIAQRTVGAQQLLNSRLDFKDTEKRSELLGVPTQAGDVPSASAPIDPKTLGACVSERFQTLWLPVAGWTEGGVLGLGRAGRRQHIKGEPRWTWKNQLLCPRRQKLNNGHLSPCLWRRGAPVAVRNAKGRRQLLENGRGQEGSSPTAFGGSLALPRPRCGISGTQTARQ